MKNRIMDFKHDPLRILSASDDKCVRFFTDRDLLNKNRDVKELWDLPEAKKILRKQLSNGGWKYPEKKNMVRSQENYNQVETYRNLAYLVEQFGFTKENPAIAKAAEFLFGFQSPEGDLRGIYWNQYSPNYTAGISELLIKAGYEKDPRIKKVFTWLTSIRQSDGGWAIPFRTHKIPIDVLTTYRKTVKPEISLPFSHLITGVVLRAYAAHPEYCKSEIALQAGQLLTGNLFEKDNYSDRAGYDYWLRFSYPFWFTDLISALDSLSCLGFSKTEPKIADALKWFVKHQKANASWDLKIIRGQNKKIIELWLVLGICRIFKRFNEHN